MSDHGGRGAPGTAGGIVGVGVDAVDVARFRRVLERRPRFATRCFTDSEQSDAGRSTDTAQSLAAGTGATRNAPSLVLHGTAATLAGARGAGRFHLSLTHTDGVAIAFVVAEQAQAASCAPS